MPERKCLQCKQSSRHTSRNGKTTYPRCEKCQREYWRVKENGGKPKDHRLEANRANGANRHANANWKKVDEINAKHLLIVDGDQATLCHIASHIPLTEITRDHIVGFYQQLGYRIVTADSPLKQV